MSELQPKVNTEQISFCSLSFFAFLPSEANREPLPVRMFESDLNGPKANMAELLVKEGLACLKQGSDDFSVCCNVTCYVHLPVVCNSVVFDPH